MTTKIIRVIESCGEKFEVTEEREEKQESNNWFSLIAWGVPLLIGMLDHMSRL